MLSTHAPAKSVKEIVAGPVLVTDDLVETSDASHFDVEKS
jgi:hypothetical protein